jgi:hypothetical protein
MNMLFNGGLLCRIENAVNRRMGGQQEAGENYRMKTFVMFTIHQILVPSGHGG